METPFIARRWAEGQGDPLPLSDQLKIWRRYKGQGLRLGRKILLNAASGYKIFLPTSRFIGPDTEMKCQVRRRRPRSSLTLTRDEPRTLLLEEGKGCKAFPSCPAVSVKMGCRGLCSLLGCGAKPRINEVQRA